MVVRLLQRTSRRSSPGRLTPVASACSAAVAARSAVLARQRDRRSVVPDHRRGANGAWILPFQPIVAVGDQAGPMTIRVGEDVGALGKDAAAARAVGGARSGAGGKGDRRSR